jgi:5-methylthioadenosine/S-adenosylhomocysteine deaminase
VHETEETHGTHDAYGTRTDGRCLLLEGGHVLTLDDDATSGRLSVAVCDGRIAGIGPASTLRADFRTAERVSCRGRIIMPGLVNAHLHPDLHVLKGELEDLSLHDWPGAHRFTAAVDLLGTPEGAAVQRASIRAALAEAALSGTTTVATYGISAGAERVCAESLAEVGLRGTVTIRDAEFAPHPETTPRTAWERLFPAMYRLHAEEALYPAELEAAARAHGRGERLVMHAAETAERLRIVRQRFGTTTIRLLERYGLLSPQTLLSHAVHVDADEIRLVAERGAAVVVSPAAELKLADGIAPVQDMQRHGVTIALGTDAAVCNNATDMFVEMRLLGLSQKLRYGAGTMPADDILRIATRGGAAALGAAGSFGRLAAGHYADLIMIDVRNPRMQPLVTDGGRSNVAANLVYAATGSDVTDVMVGGRWIVRRRRLRTLDTRTTLAALMRAARTMHSHLQQTT